MPNKLKMPMVNVMVAVDTLQRVMTTLACLRNSEQRCELQASLTMREMEPWQVGVAAPARCASWKPPAGATNMLKQNTDHDASDYARFESMKSKPWLAQSIASLAFSGQGTSTVSGQSTCIFRSRHLHLILACFLFPWHAHYQVKASAFCFVLARSQT